MRNLLDPAGHETIIHQQNNRTLEGAINSAEASIDVLEAANALAVWSAWTPALTSTGTDPTLGSGSQQRGRRIELPNNTITVHVDIRFGTGAAAGTGTYEVSLPVAVNLAYSQAIGSGYIFDSSTSAYHLIVGLWDNATSLVNMVVEGASLVTSSSPFTWADSDLISLTMTYEVA